MPPEFHLRLLCALCNDVVNCYNMKAEILGRCAAEGVGLRAALRAHKCLGVYRESVEGSAHGLTENPVLSSAPS